MNKIPLDLWNKALPKVRNYAVTVAFILQLLAGSIGVLKSNHKGANAYVGSFAILGFGYFLGMMVLVLLFRYLVTHGPKLLRRPAEVLVWFVLLMFCMYSLAVFSYVVRGEPKLLPQRMQNLVYGGVSVVSADAASAIAAIPAGINQEDVTTTVFQGSKTSKTIWQTRDSGDDVTQSEAQEFCVKFPPLKGNRWRLPTIAELEQRRSSEGKNGFNVDSLKLTSGALWSSDTHLIKPGDILCNRPDMANQMNYKHAPNVAVLMYYYFKTDTRQAPACDEYKTGARVLCVVDVD